MQLYHLDDIVLPHGIGSNVLIAGAGGGFDILAGLPIFYDLTMSHFQAKSNVHLLSFGNDGKYPDDILKTLLNDCNFHTIGRCGTNTLRAFYQDIIHKHHIDTLILVDGGIDSIMRGDEENPGTILEDTVSLVAASEVSVSRRILACLGFGTETDEQLNHYRALENIAGLAAAGAFLGSCSLTKHMPSFAYYKAMAEATWNNNRKSHIHTRVIPAVEGEFGEKDVYEGIDPRVTGEVVAPFINPLMGIYWFFDLMEVRRRNVVADFIKGTGTWTDVRMLWRQKFGQIKPTRDRRPIPL